MLREDSNQLFWKEKFINGLSNLFAHKIKQVLVNENNIIDYDSLTYENIISAIQKEGLKMCIDMKISNKANKDKRKAKYELGNFCEQYGLPPIAPSRKHTKSHLHKDYSRGLKNSRRKPLSLMNTIREINISISLNITNLNNKDLIKLNQIVTNVVSHYKKRANY
jgi:hypothetical protein